ncbi:MAG: tetratricopeptide repeat protein [Spirochaetota bacterium]
MKARIIIVLLLCAGAATVGAQSTTASGDERQVPVELGEGLQAFQAGEFEQALELFDAARDREDIPAWHGHALFWSARTTMALGRYEQAADTLDVFLTEYDDHPYREEARYQRARVFHLDGDYQTAVERFTRFTNDYPDSEFYPNALYWSGESLFSLGRLDEAERLFTEVTDSHPTSYRFEAARYRLDIIELSRRENELLTLLQWSHEEYLAALETFQQRERSYQEALRSYRARLAGLATEDFRAEISSLNERVAELEESLAERDDRINELLSQLRRARAGAADDSAPADAPQTGTDEADETTGEPRAEAPGAGDLELRETLLSLKAQALELQQQLLEQEENE